MDAILGYMIAIALSLLSVGQFYQWQASGMTNVQTAAAASQQVIYNKAAAQYVQDNGTSIAAIATPSRRVEDGCLAPRPSGAVAAPLGQGSHAA